MRAEVEAAGLRVWFVVEKGRTRWAQARATISSSSISFIAFKLLLSSLEYRIVYLIKKTMTQMYQVRLNSSKQETHVS